MRVAKASDCSFIAIYLRWMGGDIGNDHWRFRFRGLPRDAISWGGSGTWCAVWQRG